MRARNIKPSLFKDEELAELPIEARYLFTGLWCLADCFGRLEDRPKWIRSEIYPYEENIGVAKVHHLLQLLADGKFITRYEVGGKFYIHVRNFEKHQNPHKNERAKGSELPPPPPESESVPNKSVPVPNKSEPIPSQDGTSRDDSLFLIPDSVIPDSGKRIPVVPPSSEVPMEPQAALQRRRPAPVEIDSYAIDDWFEERISRHPKRSKNLMLAKTMISQIPEVADPAWRNEFTRVHELWIASPSWTGKNLHFAPPMDQWIADKGWKYEPPKVENDSERIWASL